MRYPCDEHRPTKTESAGVKATRDAADAVLSQLRAVHERGESVCRERAAEDAAADERASFAYWAERWLADGGSRGRALTAKTEHEYRKLLTLSVLPRWGEVDVRTLRRGQLQEWVRELSRAGGVGGRPLSASQVHQRFRLVSGPLAHAVSEDALELSPAVGVRLPSKPEGRRPTDPAARVPVEHVERLSAELPGRLRPLPLLAYYVGLRLAETRALRRGDVGTGARTLAVQGKGGRPATVAVPASVAAMLVEHLAEHVGPDSDAPLLPAALDPAAPAGASAVRDAWDAALRRAGLPAFTRHDLRAAGESAVADAHGVEAAARWARHDVAVALRHYRTPDPAEAGRVAATLDALRDEATSGEPEP